MPLLLIVAMCGLALVTGAAVSPRQGMQSTIAFTSTRDDPATLPAFVSTGEIYLMTGDGADPRRLTTNQVSDISPTLSPGGTKIIFESNRRRAAGEPHNVSDMFLMNIDGTEQTWLRRGSSATWSPDGTSIAFHASASGTGLPATPYPGSATTDSDIFIVSLRDLIEKHAAPRNITNNPAAVDDDPDWSPDGRTILFTSHSTADDYRDATSAEIYTISADGTGKPKALTSNKEEERAPAWSPDGTKIVFHRAKARGLGAWDLWLVNADGTGESRLTDAPGYNGFANWGQLGPRR